MLVNASAFTGGIRHAGRGGLGWYCCGGIRRPWWHSPPIASRCRPVTRGGFSHLWSRMAPLSWRMPPVKANAFTMTQLHCVAMHRANVITGLPPQAAKATLLGRGDRPLLIDLVRLLKRLIQRLWRAVCSESCTCGSGKDNSEVASPFNGGTEG
jgi:hypothetical protein